jgi:hypothetical protein
MLDEAAEFVKEIGADTSLFHCCPYRFKFIDIQEDASVS